MSHRRTNRRPVTESLECRRLLTAELASDVLPGTAPSQPEQITATADGKIYFMARNSTASSTLSLYVFDPASSTTTLLFTGTSSPFHLTAFGNELYFDGRKSGTGFELYKSNGTVAGTVLVKDIAPNSADGVMVSGWVAGMTVANGELWTSGAPTGMGSETLWKTGPGGLVNTNIHLPFLATNIVPYKTGFVMAMGGGLGVWWCDGVSAPVQVMDHVDGDNMHVLGDKLYFTNFANFVYTQYVTDGTAAGTHATDFTSPIRTTANGIGYTGIGNDLWKTDGTTANSSLVAHVKFPGASIDVNGVLYFLGEDFLGKAVWRTDGTASGTVRAIDLNGWGYDGTRALARIGDTYYYNGKDTAHNSELFRGTASPTFVDQRTLSIAGGLSANAVSISQVGNTISVDTNGNVTTFNTTAVDRIVISGGNGNDVVNITTSLTDPIEFHGGLGSNALNVSGAGTAVTIAGDLGVNAASTSVNVATGATATFGALQHLASLSIDGSALVTPNVNASGLGIQTGTLSIGATGVLDLANNDLIATNTPKATIESYIATAYNFGDWLGVRGIFSTSARDNPSGNTTLGLLSGDEFANNNGGTFDGAVVSNSDVLVKYTYFGDVDFNGSVDVSDYNLIDFGFSNHLTGWANGDADYSGAIDASDYNVVDFAFSTQGGAL